jgi:hypothetical protein
MKNGKEKGYLVTKIYAYPGGAEANGRVREWVEIHMNTPLKDGKGTPLKAVGTVNRTKRWDLYDGYSGKIELKNMYPFHDMMLTSHGRNIEDLSAEAGIDPADFEIFDEEGKRVPYTEALDRCGCVMSAAAEYPHVFTREEFEQVSVPLQNAAMKSWEEKYGENPLGSVKDRYEKYLEKARAEIESGIPYVGEITSLAQFDNFRENYWIGCFAEEDPEAYARWSGAHDESLPTPEDFGN